VPFDFLQSLFIAELVRPSARLWLSSPWISDVEVIDNSARQFSSLNPEWPARRIRLVEVLASLLDRGAAVVIIVNEDPHNDEFLERMALLTEQHPGRVTLIRVANIHEKGILGGYFTLNGSMNLTYNGFYINQEFLIYRTDPAVIAERRLTLEEHWKPWLSS
jgi:phosphatidylserine/phosphatidylglycerophosphate/cardiolipin synthase-like enzyme